MQTPEPKPADLTLTVLMRTLIIGPSDLTVLIRTLIIGPSDLTAAFALWETQYRAEPEGFLTEDETARMAVADISEQRSIYFLALLRQINAGKPVHDLDGIAQAVGPGAKLADTSDPLAIAYRLADRVERLNPKCLEIGDGMMAMLREDAQAFLRAHKQATEASA